jgi:alkyl sulfatase BDS1-like metallo-beta-lactamase superfamily hydrolase
MPYRPEDATQATAVVNREALARYEMNDRQVFSMPIGGSSPRFNSPWSEPTAMSSSIRRTTNTSRMTPSPGRRSTPSLWRQSQVIKRGGPYKLAERVYQVRNNDIANLSVIDGDDGSS